MRDKQVMGRLLLDTSDSAKGMLGRWQIKPEVIASPAFSKRRSLEEEPCPVGLTCGKVVSRGTGLQAFEEQFCLSPFTTIQSDKPRLKEKKGRVEPRVHIPASNVWAPESDMGQRVWWLLLTSLLYYPLSVNSGFSS